MMGLSRSGQQLDLMILKIFSNQRILWLSSGFHFTHMRKNMQVVLKQQRCRKRRYSFHPMLQTMQQRLNSTINHSSVALKNLQTGLQFYSRIYKNRSQNKVSYNFLPKLSVCRAVLSRSGKGDRCVEYIKCRINASVMISALCECGSGAQTKCYTLFCCQ